MKDSLLPALAALLLPFSSSADTEVVDGIEWTYMVSYNESAVENKQYSSWAGQSFYHPAIPSTTCGAITVPTFLGGHLVTSIGKNAFENCSGLTSITIPDSVSRIGEYAFSGCSGLTNIVIGGGVKSIEDDAFSRCFGLKSITIPDGVAIIGARTFSSCSGLTSVTIPDSVTNIGDWTFSGCSGLDHVYLPNSYSHSTAYWGLEETTMVFRYVMATFDPAPGEFSSPEDAIMAVIDSEYGERFCCATPVLMGYSFDTWTLDGNPVTAETIVTASTNHIISAAWKANKYEVAFDGNGGIVEMQPITVTFDAPYGELPTAEREGYVFTGWMLGGINITKETVCKTGANHVLVASWAPIFTISFNSSGGVGAMLSISTTNASLPKCTFEKSGFFFLGWALSPDGEAVLLDGDSTSEIEAEAGETVTLYAVWHEESALSDNRLVAWYSFDGDASDSSGNANDGIVNGATLTEDRNGNADCAYYFDGNDTIVVPNNATLQGLTGEFTIATWIKYERDFGGWIPVLCKGSDRQYGLVVNVNPNELDEIGPGYAQFAVKPERGVWTHIATSFDSNHVASAYVNGVLVGTYQVGKGITQNSGDMLIGADPPGSTEYLYGSLDDLGIWSRALSANEISKLYANGRLDFAYALRFDANGGEFAPENGLNINYYDISSSGYSTWTQSEAAMTNYFASRMPTIVTNTMDWGSGLATGHTSSSPLDYSDRTKIANFGMTAVETGICRLHGEYASEGTDNFAAFLSGSLSVVESGTYSFAAVADDYVVIYVDGTKVANSQWANIASGSIALEVGLHSVSIGYYEISGGQGFTIQWKRPGDASYTPIPQSVLFQDRDGVTTTALPKHVYASADAVGLPDDRVRRTGYSLAGWATEPDGPVVYPATGTLASGIAASNGETVTLYAVWTANEYTATFDADGGEISPVPEAGLDLLYYDIPDTRYYDNPDSDYLTWSASETALTNYFASMTPTIVTNTLVFGESLDPGIAGIASSSVSTLRSWGMNGLRFEANGTTNRFHGKYAQKSQENIGTCLSGVIEIEDPGTYSFASIADDYEAIFIDGQRVCSSIWENIGSGSLSLSAGFHKFSMGFAEGSGGHGFAVQWKKPGDTVWSPLPQSVLRSSQRYKNLDSKVVTFDAAYGELPTASQTGYTFAKWTINGTGITSETICTQPSNHVIVATWTPNEYEVSFDPTGGTVSPESKAVTFDAAYGGLPTPTSEGYVFLDWRLDGAAVDAATIVRTADDHTLSARWGIAVGNGVWEETIGDEPIALGAPETAPTGAVEIPAEIAGRPVVAIGADAFAGNTAITAITVPESVTNIADGAFAGCSGLENLYLPLRFGVDADDLSIPSTCAVVYRGTLSVSSAHGNPVPGVGTTNLELVGSTSLACSVDGVEDSGDGVRYVCAGWTGTGMVPASGAGTNATVALTENATLTWHWTTNVWAECVVTGDATSDGLAAWLEKDGASAVVSFAPDGEPFTVALSGDTDGVVLDTTACTVSIPADRPRSVGVAVCVHRIDNAVETGAAAAWTSGADAVGGWHVAADPTAADGYSLRSDEIAASQTAAVQVSLPLAGTLSFDWRVSSAVRKHFACFYVDGARQDRISGETDWATVALDLGDGPHTIRWTYEKSSAAASGDDAAFLDNVRWNPLTLPEALDETNVVWTTEGGADWTPQVSVSADGRSAARSGALVGEDTSRLVASVDGPGTFAWKWKTDVEDLAGVDVYLDGTMLDEPYLMDEPDWTDASLAIEGDGPHRVEFRFWNGGTEATISDCAYIDCASWDPAFVRVEGVAVPTDWIRDRAAEFVAAADGDVFAAARATASNGVNRVWQCYVAGLDPSSATDRLLATISIDGNGEPAVAWTPDLAGARDYAVDGKASLTNEWGVWDEDSRFFRVRVAMPGGFGSFLIAFDSAGGTPVDPISTDYGAPVVAPDAPTKAGYSFAGWTPPLPDTMPAHDLSLRALWSANRYTITFDGAGGSAVEPITADYGAPVFAPAAPTREGYTFAGWMPEFPATMPLDGAMLTAQWTTNRYSVLFEPGEGAGTMENQPFYYDVTQSLSQCTFANGGRPFAGWATNANGAVVYADGAIVANLASEDGAVVTLWAVWAEALSGLAIRYYDIDTPNNSVWSQSELPAIGDFASRTPTMETNTLDWGESLDAGFTTLPNSSQQSEWRSAGLTVPGSHCLLHGTYANESANYFAALLTGKLRVEEQGRYEFASVADDLVILFIDGERVLTNNQSWEVVATGNAELAAGTHSITVVFYENYNAQGLSVQWRKPGDSSYAPIPQSVLSHWAGTDTLAFDANGGEGVMESIEVDRNFGAKLPICTFAKADMQFAGWATNQAGAVVYENGAYVPPGIATLWAVWALDRLSASLNSDLVFTKGGDAEWFAETDDTHDGVSAARSGAITHSQSTWIDTTVAGPGTVSFWWKVSSEDSYDYLRFYLDGSQQASASGTGSVWMQQTFTVSGEGSHTLRWTYSKDGSVSDGSDCGWVDEIVWTPDDYVLRFDANGGTGTMLDMTGIDCGESVTLPSCGFARTGWTFVGWAASADGPVAWSDGATVADGFASIALGRVATLYARWSQGTYTVRFDANGGTGTMPDATLWLDVPQFLPRNAFSKAGMCFAGWATNETGDVIYADGALVENLATEDGAVVTLWAVWTANPLYLVVDVSSGSGDAAVYPVSGLSDVPAGGWTDEYKTTKIVLRRVDPGSFTMGSPDDEIGRSSNEDRHGVTITKPFYIGVFQVTQKQWECVMGDNPSAYTGDKRPVEHVSYYDIRGGSLGANWPASSEVDATSFLGRLRARAAGHAWELPTEAQWEYACRAGTDTALNSGENLTGSDEDSNMDEVGRYYYNRYDGKGGYSERHTAVGSYLPNAWGLYDMHGNVLEWCADRYQEHLGTAPAVDPVGPDSGSYCVRRSGGSANGADCQRSAHRDGLSAPSMNIDFNTGFRLAASASE